MESSVISTTDASTIALAALIGGVAVLVPPLLLQIALRRTDELSVMVCMAAQPILSFALSLPSPAYNWSTMTLCGVLIVSLFVGLNILAVRKVKGLGPEIAAGAN
jgi:hypothetical protein